MTVSEEKARLRKRIAAAVAAMDVSVRRRAEAVLLARANGLPELRRAERIFVYAPLPDEIDILPLCAALLADGRTLAFPRIVGKTMTFHVVADPDADLVPGAHGIREPSERAPRLDGADAVLVPGRAFTPSCRRLGRGGGYYDALLDAADAASVALAYDEQIVDALPIEDHDRPVDVVATPSDIHRRDPDGGSGTR